MGSFDAPPGSAVPSAGWTPPTAPEERNLRIEASELDLALRDASAPVAPPGIAVDSPGATAPARDSQLFKANVAALQRAATRKFFIGAAWTLGGAALTRLSPYLMGGNFRVVFWGPVLFGGYLLVQGLGAHMSAPIEARKLISATPEGEPNADVQILEDGEGARRVQAEREQRDAERRERFATLGAIPALLDDDDLARQASQVKRIYGPAVCASFLKRKAAELGFGDIDVTEDDIPDSF